MLDHRDHTYYPNSIKQDHKRQLLIVDYDYVPSEKETPEEIAQNNPSGEYPAEYQVCPDCNGKGKYVNPSIDRQGLTSEDFAEDPDFLHDYMSGVFDITCRSCNGRNVILMPTTDQGKKIIANIIEDERQYFLEIAAERRACGYY